MNYYENVFDSEDLEIIWHDYLRKPEWNFWHHVTDDADTCHWSMDFKNKEFFTDYLFKKLKLLIGEYTLRNVYANGQTYGLDGYIHLDSDKDEDYTFIYYPMQEWDLTWSGETIIIRPEGFIETVYPRPNTGILFPSKWPHAGRGPSRVCNDLRISIVYKLTK